MVDILAIGSGAVNAYRQALSTTSNNIANTNTPGYTRRSLSVSESFPVQEGIFSFGTGAQATSVARAYDEFIERSLRDSTSDLKVNEPVIEFANRIVDLIATETGSLANAMDDFFNAAEQLSTDPRSDALRRDFLSSGELIAARFNELSVQIDKISEDSEINFRREVDELNALSEQLLKVNQQLNRKHSIDKQPPSLLDQRDNLLREMSELVKLGVTELKNGQVVVNFGGSGRGFEIVTPTASRQVGILTSGKSAGADLRLVLDPVGTARPLPTTPSGTIGGAMALSSEVLRPVRVGLDHLAQTFAAESNKIHRSGLDAEGDFGQDLFGTSSSFVVSADTARGTVSASAKVIDPTIAPTEAMELMYKESTNTWDVIDLLTRERLGEVGSGENQIFEGVMFSLEGAPENGDVVIFSPEIRPARTFELLVKDAKGVAVSAAMRSTPSASNNTSTEATLAPIPREDQPQGFEFGFALENDGDTTRREDVTISADGLRPVIQVAQGTQGAQILFDIGADADQQIQVLTREGVHVAGTADLTQAEGSNLLLSDSGFGDGGYNKDYLNQTGADAYLDTSIKFGAVGKAEEVKHPAVDPDTGVLTEITATRAAQITSKSVSPTGNASGSTTTLVESGAINFNHTYHDASDSDADDEGYVTKSIALDALELADGETISAASMASYFNAQFDKLTNANVVATAQTRLFSDEIDATKSLTINGVTIGHSATAKLNEMIQSINAVSGQTGVRAEWNTDSGLALTNTMGNEGANILIGGDPVTALGIVPGTYSGTYTIGATGEEVLSNLFASDTEALNSGAGFALTLTRADNTATTVNIAGGNDTVSGIVAAINDTSSGISGINATLVSDADGYRISLHDQTGVGNSFTISTDIVAYNLDAIGNPDTDLGFNDLNNRNIGLNKPTEISLALSGTGSPSDLGRLGFATGVIFDGPIKDDFAIFMTGSGSATATLRAGPAAKSEGSSYPADTFEVKFSTDSVYTITDSATDTVVATRTYIPGNAIEYQGIRVEFNNIPKQGDSFTIEPNAEGMGNNENMLRLINLGKEPIISGQTFTAAYRDLVAGTGSRAHLAELSRDAMEVVRDQAQENREAAVGVNLDEEAADLIRFQQAYQAAAQVIQISQRMFDTLIQAS